MSKADFRKVYGKSSGRFVVSEGIAPATYILAHEGLPTVSTDYKDDRYEIVIPKGTILSVVTDSNGDSRVVPANGTGSAQNYNDGQATPDSVTVPARSVPVGAALQDVHRPFNRNTSYAASWIREAFVEWPAVDGLNSDLVAGDLVAPDALGRPVKISTADAASYPWLVVGRVIETDTIGGNFDDTLLSYFKVNASDANEALTALYSITEDGPNKGTFGVPANLDVPDVVGSFRVTLNV